MSLFDTQYKRKSGTLTAIIAMVILFLIFNFGMKYLDPPEEFGITINFGTTDFGSGNVQPKEALKPSSQEEAEIEPVEEQQIVEEKIVEPETEASKPVIETAENVITQDNEEAIAIKKQEEAKRIEDIRKKTEADKKAADEREKIEAKRRRVEKQKQIEAAKRKKLDALLGGINADGKATGGEGNDNKAGDKGKVTGDPNASGFYGNGGGVGSGGNYRLGNRKAITMPKPTYDCNEEGKVYVSISVDQSGSVIAAQAGVKGTTNSVACLLNKAKEAALKTKFNSDNKAPFKQVGIIIYNFSLN